MKLKNYTTIKYPKKRFLNLNSEYIKILALRTFGNFLVLFSLFLIIKTFYLPISEEIRYTIDNYYQKRYIVANKEDVIRIERAFASDQPKGLLAQILQIKPVEVLVAPDPEFSIIIPKIAANSNIKPSVDPSKEKEYTQALKEGVAHAKGTAFPGEGGNIYLFAHSTDYFYNVGTYNAVFYLLYKLEVGDEVNLVYNGQRHKYIVDSKKIVNPSDVKYLTRKTKYELLTLQTCWPLGTTLKRLLVFARPAVVR